MNLYFQILEIICLMLINNNNSYFEYLMVFLSNKLNFYINYSNLSNINKITYKCMTYTELNQMSN